MEALRQPDGQQPAASMAIQVGMAPRLARAFLKAGLHLTGIYHERSVGVISRCCLLSSLRSFAAPCLQLHSCRQVRIGEGCVAKIPASVGWSVTHLLPAQVHLGGQSEAMPSASAGREATVLELADLDREVTSSLHTPDAGYCDILPIMRCMQPLQNSITKRRINPALSSCPLGHMIPHLLR